MAPDVDTEKDLDLQEQKVEFTPRPYQIYLYEKALEKNTIIYLPTGTGKTYIAVLLIKKLSGSLLLPYHEKGKRTIFVVNTVSLVVQQSAFIARHTGLCCKGYSGDMQVDFWSNKTWISEISSNQVMVMTAQIFLNLVEHGILPLNRVNLLIFDECHRAVKDHPMRLIMQKFEQCDDNEQPRVLAMSASLLNSNIKLEHLCQTLKELEITFHASIQTIDNRDTVADFATNPKERVQLFQSIDETDIIKKIKCIVNVTNSTLNHINLPNKMTNLQTSYEFQPEAKTDKLRKIMNDTQENIMEMGLFGGNSCVLFHLIQLEIIKKYCDDINTITVLDYIITQLMKIQSVINMELSKCNDEYEQIHKYSSDKVLKLLDVLGKFYDDELKGKDFCSIIFVERRFSAKVLKNILEAVAKYDKKYNFLKPEYMVGYCNNPYQSAREQLCNSNWNKQALSKFRVGEKNCMVATNVVDEGVDVPTCTLVVRFEAPKDFRAYIQSKGRARHSSSHFVILASNDSYYSSRYYEPFQKIESCLQTLHGRTDSRTLPSEIEINEILYKKDIEPYIVIKRDGTKATVTEQSAINLVNYYCSTLIKSKFIVLSPTWILKQGQIQYGTAYQVHLTLPNVSRVKETIIGDFMDSIDKAKRSVALKACIALHENGELDDDLIPVKPEAIIDKAAHLFPCEENNENNVDRLAGTKGNKRHYKLAEPEALYNCFPKNDKPLFLHILNMKPSYSMPSQDDNRNLVFYTLLGSRDEFGILSSKQIPQLPSFPIFMNVGSLDVKIKNNIKINPISIEQLELLKKFHYVIFEKILKETAKEFTVFDGSNLENNYLCVPTKNDSLNWEVVNNYNEIREMLPQKPLKVTPAKYENSLVFVNYRASNVYIVTQVCEYLKAESMFPTRNYNSYIHYYQSQHGLTIEDEKQPLLEVKQISMKMNSIKPRGIKPGWSKRKRANHLEDFEEHLVPELCTMMDFPAVYWLKATALPSILHRLNQLLIAEELRVKIATDIGLQLKTDLEPLSVMETSDLDSSSNLDSSADAALDDAEDDISMNFGNIGQVAENSLEIDILDQDRNLCSWERDKEPQDLFRNAEQISRLDIEYFCHFMQEESVQDSIMLKDINKIKCNYLKAPKVEVPILKVTTKNCIKGPSVVDIVQALTTKMSNDAFNLERLETLGDSFLKYSISLYLVQYFPSYDEGPLTCLKGKIVGNLNLYYCGKCRNIPGMIKIEEFEAKSNFVVPCFSADKKIKKIINDSKVSPSILFEIKMTPEEKQSGQAKDSTIKQIKEKISSFTKNTGQSGMEHFLGGQIVPDKSVSDSVEALIGSYLINSGVSGAVKVLKWFKILPESLNEQKYLYEDIPDPVLGTGNGCGHVEDHIPWASDIEEKLGYKFKNRAFLLQAFSHPSYSINRITASYQRLEFLGDAVLDLLLTIYIYENCGNLDPGAVTDLRSALVNNITFACLAVKYGLHTALLQYAPKLLEIIDRFVKFQENRSYEINDELLWILCEEDECQMVEHVDVPKVLGDIFESAVGAIYLDCGKDLKTTWSVVYSLMKNVIDLFSRNVPKQPVRVIYETQGAHPKFTKGTAVAGGSAIMVTLSVMINGQKKLFHGFGATKKLAKTAAAKRALKIILNS